eukprot:g49172.t1
MARHSSDELQLHPPEQEMPSEVKADTGGQPEVATMTQDEMDMWDNLLAIRSGTRNSTSQEENDAVEESSKLNKAGSIKMLHSLAERRRQEKEERERLRLEREERRQKSGETGVMADWELDFEAIRDYHSTSRSRREIEVALPGTGKDMEDKADKVLDEKKFSWEESERSYCAALAERRQNGWRPHEPILSIPEEGTENEEAGWATFVAKHGEGAARLSISESKGIDLSMSRDGTPGAAGSPRQERPKTEKEIALEEFRKEREEGRGGLAFETQAARGANFIKYNRYNVSAKRLLRCSTNGTVDWGSGSLHLRDAIKITEPSYRLVREKFGASPPQLCILIRMPQRDLCLRARSEQERDLWLNGLVKLKKEIDIAEENVDEDNKTGQGQEVHQANIFAPNANALDFKKAAFSGRTFIKHSRRGAPHQRLVRVNFNSGAVDWSSGSLSLKDALEVAAGKKTGNFKNVKDKAAPQELCFSIILPARTLDLQASSEEERDVWVRGLTELMEKLSERDETRFAGLNWQTLATNGHSFIKHGRKGKPHPRMICLDLKTGVLTWGANVHAMDPNNSINIKDIYEIALGCNHGVFAAREYAKGLDERLCFSLLCPTRSLDLQAETPAERNLWTDNLKRVMTVLKEQNTVIAAKRHTPRQRNKKKPEKNSEKRRRDSGDNTLLTGQAFPSTLDDLDEVDDEAYDAVLNTPRESASKPFFVPAGMSSRAQHANSERSQLLQRELSLAAETTFSGRSMTLEVHNVDGESESPTPVVGDEQHVAWATRRVTMQEEQILQTRIAEQNVLLQAMAERLDALRQEKSALQKEVSELEKGVTSVESTPFTPSLGVFLAKNHPIEDDNDDDDAGEEEEEEQEAEQKQQTRKSSEGEKEAENQQPSSPPLGPQATPVLLSSPLRQKSTS